MRRSWCAALVLVGVAAGLSCRGSPSGVSVKPPPLPDSVGPGDDWTRFGWDVGRSSASTAPTGITASNVGSLHLQQVTIPGTVDASVIYLSDVQIEGAPHDAFFMTTTYGKTVAVNANTGVILWTYTPTHIETWSHTGRIMNSTPVADPDRANIYAASPDGHIQKLAVADGHVVWSTAITLLPGSEKMGSSLNFFAGHVIATTDGYVGDAPPYQGHVAILDAASGQLLHVWNSLCSDRLTMIDPTTCTQSGSAIWGRAGAVIDSTNGDIYVATGNGLWDGSTFWGDAMLRLDSSATHILGNWTPTNTADLATQDLDIGSTSPVLVGGGNLVQGGKDGQIRVLSTAGIAGATPHKGGELQSVSTPSGTDLYTAIAVLHTKSGLTLFGADNGATAAWTLNGGHLTTAWHNGNSGTSPVVAGGLLYVYDPQNGGLRVYQPATGAPVTTLPTAVGHWNSPIIIDGKIALPEGNANTHVQTGILDIWRIP